MLILMEELVMQNKKLKIITVNVVLSFLSLSVVVLSADFDRRGSFQPSRIRLFRPAVERGLGPEYELSQAEQQQIVNDRLSREEAIRSLRDIEGVSEGVEAANIENFMRMHR